MDQPGSNWALGFGYPNAFQAIAGSAREMAAMEEGRRLFRTSNAKR